MPRLFDGNWFLGATACERIIALNSKLKNDLTQQIESKTKIQDLTYRPWMSFTKVPIDILNDNSFFNSKLNSKPFVVSSPLDLDAIDRLLYSSESPLGSINPDPSDRLRVCVQEHLLVGRFATEMSESIAILCRSNKYLEKLLHEIAIEIIPLCEDNPEAKMREMGSGISSLYYRGGIFLGLPKQFEFAIMEGTINLAHELGHQMLFVYQLADDIVHTDSNPNVYSTFRGTERPALLAFHALAALSAMLYFLASFLEANRKQTPVMNFARTRFKELLQAHKRQIESFSNTKFTNLGAELYSEFQIFHKYLGTYN